MSIKGNITTHQELMRDIEEQTRKEKQNHESFYVPFTLKGFFIHIFVAIMVLVAILIFSSHSWLFPLLIIAFLTGVEHMRKKIQRQRKIRENIRLKLLRQNDTFVSEVQSDASDHTLSAEQIVLIEEMIRNIVVNIRESSQQQTKCLHYLRKARYILPTYFIRRHHRFIKKEMEWLIDFITSFSGELNQWIALHKIELEQLEKTIEQQTSETSLPE